MGVHASTIGPTLGVGKMAALVEELRRVVRSPEDFTRAEHDLRTYGVATLDRDGAHIPYQPPAERRGSDFSRRFG